MAIRPQRPNRRFRKRRLGGFRRKRWSVGVGYGPFRASFNSKRNYRRSLGKKVRSIVRNTLVEPKLKVLSAVQNVLTQKSIYSLNLLGNIGQGSTKYDREGDDIFIDSLKMRYWMINSQTYTSAVASVVHWRVMVLKHNFDMDGASDTWHRNSFTYADIFLNSESGTSTANVHPCLGLKDPKCVTVAYDAIHCVTDTVSAGQNSTLTEITVPIHQKFVYRSSNSNYGKHGNWYVILIPYAYGKTTDVDNVLEMYMTSQLYFKDAK